MEAILELLFTIALEIVDTMNFKKYKMRTRVISGIMVLFFGIVSSVPAVGAVSFFKEGNTVGAIVMGIITLAFVVAGIIIVIRGHKTGWEKI